MSLRISGKKLAIFGNFGQFLAIFKILHFGIFVEGKILMHPSFEILLKFGLEAALFCSLE